MHVRRTTILGFARLRLLAGLRWWRPKTCRYAEEQAEIDALAGADPLGQALSLDFAREIAELARLIKGYGDTFKRGLGNYHRIAAEVIAPALAGRMTPQAAADAVAERPGRGAGRSRRRTALPDPGRDRRVAGHAAPCR